MAKVYSWEVSINPYAYAYIVHPNDTERAYVGTELKGNNLQKVIDWVAECSDEDYIEHFNMVKELCEEKNYSVKFENVNAYMDVNTSCDNLRGPAGKGIINITLTNSTELVDTYTINYTDGTNTSFVVRHGKPGGSGGTGDTEDVSVSTYFAMIYTSGRDENGEILGEVTTPTGGTYDWIEYELTPPIGWQESDSDNEGNALEPPVWMSSKTFIKGHEEEGGWSTPTMISGENGKPGVDGASLEFIYTQASKKPNTPTENDKNIPGFVPTTEGWYPSPKGVDEDNRREWFTTRLYDKTKETWGDWNTPAIWSQYGVNGQDGDGVEYIYYLDNTGEVPFNPTPNNYKTNEEYKKDEWLPSDMGGAYRNKDNKPISTFIAGKWTDNPTSVDATNQWEWVAVRKYKRITEEGTTKGWGEFSDPSLWSKYGETGQPGANATTIRKVYKMTDSTSKVPAPPTDNSYTDWNNAFPVDYTIDKCVWCCEAEMWAHNNEFVERYRRVSKVDDEKNTIVKPYDATTENTLRYPSFNVPEEYTKDSDGKEYKYLQIKIKDSEGNEGWGHYYQWKGGWSEPYLVTGTKGASVASMDYVTYVFYYGERNNSPSKGEEGKTLDDIKNDGWYDFPIASVGTDGDVYCWYQCCLSMDSNNKIKEWGNIHPCNGRDGKALPGKYTEFRFAVTNNDSNVPVKPTIITTPGETGSGEIINNRYPGYNISNDSIKRWVATNEQNFPTLGKDQTMWQIFAVINPNGDDGNGGVTDVVEKGWKGPIQVSAENGKDSTVAGPAGKQGVSGIPGANFKVKYCLGTFSEKTGECYWKVYEGGIPAWKGWSDTPETVKYGSGYFGRNPSDFDNDLKSSNYWFDFPPNSEIIKFDKGAFTGYTESGEYIDYKQQAYEGRVIRRKMPTGYGFAFIYYNGKEYANRDISVNTLTLEEAENFHVYVWCVQGTETWKKLTTDFDYDKTTGDVTNDYNVLERIEWGIPFKMQGTNGLDGLKGADGRSQTVYPMGIYSSNEVYLTTESKAPYVYDANDGNFYVLNRANQPWVGDLPDDFKTVIIHPSTANSGNTGGPYSTVPSSKGKEFIKVTNHKEQITDTTAGTIDNTSATFYYQWSNTEGKYVPASYYKYAYDYGYGSSWIAVAQDETTPCQNYQSSITNKHDPAWVKFESFDALYTSIGIIENGMIGSAVYNNEFMFSQQGLNASGEMTDYATESAKENGGFLSGYEYDKEAKKWKYKGTTNKYISDGEVNPYEMKVTPDSTTPVHSFRPNITLNFKTGQAYLSTGEITFGDGVMTAHTGIFNNVVVNGTYNTQVLVINDKNKDEYIHNGYLLLSNVPDIVIFDNLGDMTLKLPYYYPVYYYRDLFPENEKVDINNEKKYTFKYNDNEMYTNKKVILAEVPSGQENRFYQVKDYNKISRGNLCYYTDYGYKKEGEKYVINNLTDVRSYIGREMYFFNKGESGGKITIECGEVFTTNKELEKFVRVSSVNYANEWILPTISHTSNNKYDFTYVPTDNGDDDRLYEEYIMHARHPAIIGNNSSTVNYTQNKLVIDNNKLCIAKCDIGNYAYIIDKKTHRNSLLGWRFNMVDDDMSDIYYNDSYLRTVHIYDKNKAHIFKFEIVSDWTWNTFLSSSFKGTEKFIYDENGYVEYNHKDGNSYYLVNSNTPQKDTANLNTSIIINGVIDYYLSDTIVN